MRLYFSPHYDDVVLSCGGLICDQVQHGETAVVITVFGGQPKTSALSAFARHLLAKDMLDGEGGMNTRREEDKNACRILGAVPEHWDFLEAPFRHDRDEHPLYCSYDEMNGSLAERDAALEDEITASIISRLRQEEAQKEQPILYFPLGASYHVDHQLLGRVGCSLSKEGYRVLYYGEWPYVETDGRNRRAPVKPTKMLVDKDSLAKKIQAAQCYTSQVSGLGGTSRLLEQRLRRFAYQVGEGRPAEHIWDLESCADSLVRQEPCWSLANFKSFLHTRTWSNLADVLPVGGGICLDVGCGQGRHKEVVARKGYRWIGLDYSDDAGMKLDLRGDAQNLPIASAQVACVVHWGVLSYLKQPEQAFAECARVLEVGGVLGGYAPFLEPVHGETLYGLHPLAVSSILREHGFTDIQIIPGISGFTLILWTWLRRYGGDRLAFLALPLTAIWMIPLAAFRFLASWLWWRVGRGSGHGMQWISQQAPLEFAGHLVFVARKSRRGPDAHRISQHRITF